MAGGFLKSVGDVAEKLFSTNKKGMVPAPAKPAPVAAVAPQTIVPGGASVIDTIRYKNEQTRRLSEGE